MRVILKETIDTLGIAGAECEVAAGYGRNYLLPQGKAIIATPQNRKVMEQTKAKLELQIAKERKLTVNTVYTHFSKLIQQEKIAIEDILDSQKLTLLKDKIAEPEATSLSDMKDLVGSKVTWDELKLYRASFLI